MDVLVSVIKYNYSKSIFYKTVPVYLLCEIYYDKTAVFVFIYIWSYCECYRVNVYVYYEDTYFIVTF